MRLRVTMKSLSNTHTSWIVVSIVAVFAIGLAPVLSHSATVPTITLPQKTITVFSVAILKPTGNPVTAPSLDNQFTYSGAAGVAIIPVEANVTPLKVENDVKDLIKWTFTSIPTGSVLTWNNSWPGDSTAGKGKSAVATLTGYPANNSVFGPRTIKMEVIRNGKVLFTKTTPIELFFNRDDVATGRSLPNWIFYWSQAIGSGANIAYQSANASGAFGVTPAMLYWSYSTAHDKTKIIIYDQAKFEDSGGWAGCSSHTPNKTTGIDAFEDTVIHEGKHVIQIAQADPIVGTSQGTPWRYGWSWNQGSANNHWTLGADGKAGVSGIDDDGVNGVDDLTATGPGELGNGDDVSLTDTGDSTLNWPLAFGPLPAGCWPTGAAIEEPAYSIEPDAEDTRKNVDWSDPGKQHLTSAYND